MDELDKDVKKAKNRKTSNKNTIPLEWKQLKEIYPEAEMNEYSQQWALFERVPVSN